MDIREKRAVETTRVYSVVDIKELDDEKREFTGIATTPATDRMDDIVEPMGGEYKLPISLLWQHDRYLPVGIVVRAKATKNGIEVTGRIPKVDQPAGLAARLEEAWQSLKHQLVRGLSIGFSPKEYSFIENGGIHFTKWEWLELSLVTIPANSEATILSIKSFDQKQRAALGQKSVPIVRLIPPAGASAKKSIPIAKPVEGNNMKTIAQQIAEFEQTRLSKSTDMEKIMVKASEEGITLDAEQADQYDTLESEVAAIDKHLERLRNLQKTQDAQIKTAKPVSEDPRGVQHGRVFNNHSAPAVVRSVKNEEPGIGFARFALAMYAAKGDVHSAKSFAEHAFASDTRLQGIMKAAVAAGTTTSATWAGNLVDYQNLSAEFVEYLRPRTIVGQFGTTTVGGVAVPALRRVPFNVRIPGKTGAGTAQWVGEGYRKPVTASSYEATTLKWAKIAAISVVTDELDRFSDPAIQTLVRDDLAEAVIERMDIDFIDPAKAVGTGASESPASITNGVTAIASSGSTADDIRADLNSLWAVADETNMPGGSAVYITDSKTARALAMLQNPLGQPEFASVTPTGGSINGVPLIVSNYVGSDSSGSLFILAFASEIYLADDGMVNIDISREATIYMDSAAATETPTAAQLVSMFQTNQLAIRAERYVRWQKRRPQAVAYLENVAWG